MPQYKIPVSNGKNEIIVNCWPTVGVWRTINNRREFMFYLNVNKYPDNHFLGHLLTHGFTQFADDAIAGPAYPIIKE